MRAAVSVTIMSCLLWGCAVPGQMAAGSVGTVQKIVVRDDPFQPFVEFRSPGAMIKRPPNFYRVELFGRQDRRTKRTTIFVRVDIAYLTLRRRKYRIARNASAQRLRITKISGTGNCRGQGPCIHNEIFDVAIAPGELRRAGKNGYALKLFDKMGGAFKITISRAKIAALFAKMDNYQPMKNRQADSKSRS